MPQQSFRPLHVLITGAEGALGASVVQRFHVAGCTVFATFFNEPLAEWKAMERVIPVHMNVGDSQSIQRALGTLGGRPVEAWIHCAGGFRYAASDAISNADLDFLINANVKSAFLLARELVPGMKSRNFGRIVLIGSKAALHPGVGMGPYAATKAAIHALTQSLAEETKKFDINVNAVLPTIIDTPANRKDMPDADFNSWVKREDLAEILFSLTQPSSKAFHGALLPVAGRV